MRFPSCLYVCVSPPLNFWMPEPIFIKLGMYIMATEPIWTAYILNPSHHSVSVCVSLFSLLGNSSVNCIPLFIARQRLGENVTAATNTRNNRRIVAHSIFYAVRVVSKASRVLVLLRTSCTIIILCLQRHLSPSDFSNQILYASIITSVFAAPIYCSLTWWAICYLVKNTNYEISDFVIFSISCYFSNFSSKMSSRDLTRASWVKARYPSH
jgi:hypothetical protein